MVNRKLKGLRVTYGENQQDVADLLGIGETAYNMKETGKRNFTPKEMKILMIHYKLTPEQFIDVFFDFEVHTKETEKAEEAEQVG